MHYNYLSRYLIWATDVFLSVVATLLSYLFLNYLVHINIVPGIALLFLLWSMVFSIFWTWVTKTYDGIIRHATVTEFVRIIYAMLLKAVSLLVISFFIFEHVGNFVLAIITLDFVISVFLLMLMRTTVATFYYSVVSSGGSGTMNTMIFSSEDESAVSLANYLRTADTQYNMVGFLTRDPHKNNYRMLGHKFFYIDSMENIQPLFEKYKINCLLFTSKDDLHSDDEIFNYGLKHNISMRIAPMADVSEEQASIQLRSIHIEDLLGRNEIKINLKEIDNQLKDMTVMVTGAAGSIGSELCRQLCKFHLKQLIMVDFSETALYEINMELTKRYPNNKITSIISDVRNSSRMEANIRDYRPDYIFHAAAYKHVPMMELYPCEAVRANVLGTMTVADLAVKYGVQKFIMISTDKAVHPSSVMGASKRIAEMYVQSYGNAIKEGKMQGKTSFITTRFGNVLGSNGSVIPLFRKQIEKGGPVTVTDPDIIRYFMTIPEACRLVLEAAYLGEGNDVFVFDMGKPVKIIDLARRMIELSGLIPDKDIKITFTGLRPGEKLYEELLRKSESDLPTENPMIFRAESIKLDYQEVRKALEHLIDCSYHEDKRATVQTMKDIVSDYKSMHSVYEQLDKVQQ
ncbi:MAG: polysaccharide biosynthesis protein [Prevotella sp.]|nr:polysaccharide biosynthesis protein [Prevotella sp.]MBQ9222331.1 polysaccharide biosynthesis protein [Prevotella sp.]